MLSRGDGGGCKQRATGAAERVCVHEVVTRLEREVGLVREGATHSRVAPDNPLGWAVLSVEYPTFGIDVLLCRGKRAT